MLPPPRKTPENNALAGEKRAPYLSVVKENGEQFALQFIAFFAYACLMGVIAIPFGALRNWAWFSLGAAVFWGTMPVGSIWMLKGTWAERYEIWTLTLITGVGYYLGSAFALWALDRWVPLG